jgi:hypothetical protein
MKGGSDQYIDRVKIEQTSREEEKIKGFIKEFPHEWFESEQSPGTIVTKLDEEQGGTSKLRSFTKTQILKRFDVPVTYKSFDNLAKSSKLSELISTFEKTIGTRFSDEFFTFYIDPTNPKTSKSWNVVSKIKYTKDLDIDNFPPNPINPIDPDAEEEEPSFADEILLQIVWSSGHTIKPYLRNNPNEEDETEIRVELLIDEKPKGSPSSAQRPTISTLEKAVTPQEFERLSENKSLAAVLDQLSSARNIVVNYPADLATISAELYNFKGKLTFTDVMDTIASNTGTFWDWDGIDSALIRKTAAS